MSIKMSGDGQASEPADPTPKIVVNGKTLHDGKAKAVAEIVDGAAAPVRRALKLATVSHTLDAEVAERLRHFAFRERISESAVIEHSLRSFFQADDDSALGQQLRDRGAGLRRKN